LADITNVSVTNRNWSLSPDGSQIAIIVHDTPSILTLSNGQIHDLKLGQLEIADVRWGVTGGRLYLAGNDKENKHLLIAVDPDGHVQRLTHSLTAYLYNPRPSPDGKTLAFAQRQYKSDLVLLEFSSPHAGAGSQ